MSRFKLYIYKTLNRVILPNYNGITITGNSLTITGLTDNTDYFVQMRRYDNDNVILSNISRKKDVKTKDATISDYDINNISFSGCIINFDSITNADNYALYLYDQNDSLANNYPILSNVNSFSLTGLIPDYTYKIKIKTKYDDKESSFSIEKELNTNELNLNSPILNNFLDIGSNNLQLDIQPVVYANNYDIYLYSNNLLEINYPINTTNIQYNITGLIAESIYKVKAKAKYFSYSTSEFSNEITGTTLAESNENIDDNLPVPFNLRNVYKSFIEIDVDFELSESDWGNTLVSGNLQPKIYIYLYDFYDNLIDIREEYYYNPPVNWYNVYLYDEQLDINSNTVANLQKDFIYQIKMRTLLYNNDTQEIIYGNFSEPLFVFMPDVTIDMPNDDDLKVNIYYPRKSTFNAFSSYYEINKNDYAWQDNLEYMPTVNDYQYQLNFKVKKQDNSLIHSLLFNQDNYYQYDNVNVNNHSINTNNYFKSNEKINLEYTKIITSGSLTISGDTEYQSFITHNLPYRTYSIDNSNNTATNSLYSRGLSLEGGTSITNPYNTIYTPTGNNISPFDDTLPISNETGEYLYFTRYNQTNSRNEIWYCKTNGERFNDNDKDKLLLSISNVNLETKGFCHNGYIYFIHINNSNHYNVYRIDNTGNNLQQVTFTNNIIKCTKNIFDQNDLEYAILSNNSKVYLSTLQYPTPDNIFDLIHIGSTALIDINMGSNGLIYLNKFINTGYGIKSITRTGTSETTVITDIGASSYFPNQFDNYLFYTTYTGSHYGFRKDLTNSNQKTNKDKSLSIFSNHLHIGHYKENKINDSFSINSVVLSDYDTLTINFSTISNITETFVTIFYDENYDPLFEEYQETMLTQVITGSQDTVAIISDKITNNSKFRIVLQQKNNTNIYTQKVSTIFNKDGIEIADKLIVVRKDNFIYSYNYDLTNEKKYNFNNNQEFKDNLLFFDRVNLLNNSDYFVLNVNSPYIDYSPDGVFLARVDGNIIYREKDNDAYFKRPIQWSFYNSTNDYFYYNSDTSNIDKFIYFTEESYDRQTSYIMKIDLHDQKEYIYTNKDNPFNPTVFYTDSNNNHVFYEYIESNINKIGLVNKQSGTEYQITGIVTTGGVSFTPFSNQNAFYLDNNNKVNFISYTINNNSFFINDHYIFVNQSVKKIKYSFIDNFLYYIKQNDELWKIEFENPTNNIFVMNNVKDFAVTKRSIQNEG